MAFQITDNSIVCPTACCGLHTCKNINGVHYWGESTSEPGVDSLHKWSVVRKAFPCHVKYLYSIRLTILGARLMGLLPDTQTFALRMRRECRQRFPRHRLRRKPLVSDPDMHHGSCATHVPWCMSGSLTCGGGENVPGIPGACATRNFTYLVRGPRNDLGPTFLDLTLRVSLMFATDGNILRVVNLIHMKIQNDIGPAKLRWKRKLQTNMINYS